MMDDDVREAHVWAMRLRGFHGGSFRHTCDAGTCTRPAHWRYYPEANPLLARLTAGAAAYEVYRVAGADGRPAQDEAYAILRLADGLYAPVAIIGALREAYLYACDFALDELGQGAARELPPIG